MSNARPVAKLAPDLAPRYLEKFSCIGSACEATCCSGWQVAVDETHYRKLKHATNGSSVERARFRAGHQQLPETERRPNRFALIVLNDQHECTYLDEQKLCSIQKRYGADVLSNTCATYPRAVYQNVDRIETTATMSCPEVARLALLHADALDVVPVARDPHDHRSVTDGMIAPTDAYEAALNEVREYVMWLLSQREYSIATRLFYVAYLGQRTMPTFARGATSLEQLDEEMRRLGAPEMLASWARTFETITVPAPIAASLITELVADRLRDLPHGGFRQLCADVLTGTLDATIDETTQLDVSPQDLWERHQARLATFDEATRARIDMYVENYAKNYWLRDWYTKSPNLFLHTRRLLIRVATLRFLLVNHPRLGSSFDTTTLDAVAVEVFYKFSRGIEHSADFLKRVDAMLDARGWSTLAHVVYLLKF